MDHALAYYRVAAAKNHLNAQYNLAVLLSRGGDVKPDLREAFSWAAAAKNNVRIRPRGSGRRGSGKVFATMKKHFAVRARDVVY